MNKTLSFQGRLLRSNGSVVPDGVYNMQFKLYQNGSGTLAGNTDGGQLMWTETHANNNAAEGVTVRNGMFSLELGAKTPFTAVDWNQDTLWLSMNVAGSDNTCATFGTAPCTGDGEMLPMKRLTAVAQAINSSQLGGKTADNFIQLAQGVQEDASTNSSSIFINKTGSGNLMQLQNSGADVLSISQSGDITMGNSTDHTLSIADADAGQDGKSLTVSGGNGGSGIGSAGGDVTILGGDGGGTNGNGGNINLDSGAATGTGTGGSVFIGTANASEIQIGNNTLASGTQTINIGNATGGGTTNITIGSSGSAGGGTTKIQGKDSAVIATNGVDRATFDNNGTLTLGSGVSSNTPADFKIQGTSSSANGVSGGNLTIQGGGATNGDSDGGNLRLSGGSGSGTGSKGLVIIDTPTYTTAAKQTSATSTDVTQSNIDSFGVITLEATADEVAYTLGAPSLGANAAGRVLYVTAENGSRNFVLRANIGSGTGVEQNIAMRQNATFTMVWTGTLWTTAGGAGSSGTLQDAYNSSIQSTDAGGMIVNTAGSNGLTIRNNNDTTGNSILSVESATKSPLLSVSSTAGQLATNPGAEISGGASSTFPANTWSNTGIDAGGPGLWDAVVTRATDPDYILSGEASTKVVSQNSWTGVRNRINAVLTPGATYSVSASIRSHAETLSTIEVDYMPQGNPSQDWVGCQQNITATTAWSTVSCTFQVPTSGIDTPTDANSLYINSGDAIGTYYVDNLSITRVNSAGNVKIGNDTTGSDPTLLTLNKTAGPPQVDDAESLLGSMYYDTAVGKVQCLEAEGWGDCGSAPDTFVTLIPEYPGAVVSGAGNGTMTTDMCSDQLNINDGSSSQPTVCDSKETYNYYNWTSTQTSAQMKNIYINYRLPLNFKQFMSGSTSIMGRTDSANAFVMYQIYRNDPVDGLTACSVEQPLSNGPQTAWQKGTPAGVADPASCNFKAGDTMMLKITLSAKSSGNAYVSNFSFAHSIK